MRTLIGQSVMAEISSCLKKANHDIIELGVANELFIETDVWMETTPRTEQGEITARYPVGCGNKDYNETAKKVASTNTVL